MKDVTGIYVIKCLINKKEYIGSSINIRKRWNSHKSDLKRGKHANKILQNSWDKYGEDKFIFLILEEVTSEDLLAREAFHIMERNSFQEGFNLVETPHFNMLGFKHSEETKRKLSQNHKRIRPIDYMTEEQVDEMRKRFFNGDRITALAEDFGIHRRTIKDIVHLRRYKDYQVKIDGYEEMIRQKENDYKNGKRPRSRGWNQTEEFKNRFKEAVSKPKLANRKFTEEQVRAIRERKKNESYAEIAKDYGVSLGTIVKIIKRETYDDVK